MIIVSIDPGVSGAIVIMNEKAEYIDHVPMPTITVGRKNRVNSAAVSSFITKHTPDHAFIEQVGAMPGQGVTSMFNFGHSAGVIEGVVAGAGIPMTLITPQAWKKSAGLIGTNKDACRSRAIQLYPKLRALDLKGKGQALADALMIGRHGLGGLLI